VTLSVCPIAVVQASPERVWSLLSQPSSYALWWDAETLAITPAGPAQVGQTITAQTRELGRTWPVHITINAVDAAKHAIDLSTRLPLGITVHNHIMVAPVESGASRVTFG